MPQTEARRTTLLVVMLTITFGLMLCGVVMLLREYEERPRRQSSCGKNMSQILGAMVAYNTSEESTAWIVLDHPIMAGAAAPRLARLQTTRFCERLAVMQSLPNVLFTCPSSRSGRILIKAKLTDPASLWGQEPGKIIGYAVDWAAGLEPSSERPMIADRDPDAHGGGVMVAFGDAHVKKIKLKPHSTYTEGALFTEDVELKPFSLVTGNPPDDDIYSTEGDVGDPLAPGKGDPLRAWVK